MNINKIVQALDLCMDNNIRFVAVINDSIVIFVLIVAYQYAHTYVCKWRSRITFTDFRFRT